MGDSLLSINDQSVIGWSVKDAEGLLKSLPRGPFQLTVMAPPKDVTGTGIRETTQHGLPAPPSPPSSHHSIDEKEDSINGREEETSSLPSAEEEGVITAILQQENSDSSLGFEIEGGSDTLIKYVYIKSLAVDSPAFRCGRFGKGDQLVMVGETCLIGMSNGDARRALDEAHGAVRVVAQRKSSPKETPFSSSVELHSSGPSLLSGSDMQVHSPIDKLVRIHSADDLQKTVQSEEDDLIPEDSFPTELVRKPGEKMGMIVTGGCNHPSLKQVHVSTSSYI